MARFGMSLVEFEALVTAQDGKCYECRLRPVSKKGLVVHKSLLDGQIKGLLCGKCSALIKPRERARLRRLVDPARVNNDARTWRAINPERSREHGRRSRLKRLDAIASYQKTWNEQNKERLKEKARITYLENRDLIRDQQLMRQYGISIAIYKSILNSQGGACALCRRPPGRRSLAVDHDHVTGVIRGLLCRGCNVGIGNLRDDPALLEEAARYVRTIRTIFSVPSRSGSEESRLPSDSDR